MATVIRKNNLFSRIQFAENFSISINYFLDTITPKRLIIAIVLFQPFLEFSRHLELDILRHIIQRLLVIFLFFFFLWQYFKSPISKKIESFGIEKPLIIYFVTSLLSVIISSQLYEIDLIKSITALITIPILYMNAYLFPVWINDINSIKKIYKAILFSVFIVSFYGIIQFIVFSFITSTPFRLSSIYIDPNIFSRFILIGIFFIITQFIFTKKTLIDKKYLIIVLLMALFCLLFTFSRSGYATFFIGLVILAFFSNSKKVKFLSVFSILVLGAISFAFLFSQRTFVGGEIIEQSSFNRIQLILGGIEIITEHPLFGIGYANFANYYSKNFVESLFRMSMYDYEMMGFTSHIHNWVVEVWAEQGIFGLIAFVWLFISLFKTIKSELRKNQNIYIKPLLISSYLMVCIFLLHGFFYHTFISQFYFWVLLGISFSIISVSRKLNAV